MMIKHTLSASVAGSGFGMVRYWCVRACARSTHTVRTDTNNDNNINLLI